MSVSDRPSPSAFAYDPWPNQFQALTQATAPGAVRQILAAMSPGSLLKTALEFPAGFSLISAYLDALSELSATASSRIDDAPLSCLCSLALLCMSVYKAMVSATPVTETFDIWVSSSIQIDASRLLERFRLRFIDIRFLLTATGAIIAGSAMLALITTAPAFLPGDLDFFTEYGGTTPVIGFLKVAAGYAHSSGAFFQAWLIALSQIRGRIGHSPVRCRKWYRRRIHSPRACFGHEDQRCREYQRQPTLHSRVLSFYPRLRSLAGEWDLACVPRSDGSRDCDHHTEASSAPRDPCEQ